MNNHIAAAAEQVRQIFTGALVHRHTEGLQPLLTRLPESMPGILDAVAALVLVEVIRLAVRQQQLQAPTCRLRGKQFRGMSHGRPHAGVITGLDGIDAATHSRAIGFGEGL